MSGWYDGVPISVYHSAQITAEPSVSSSGLRMLWRKSPKHFYAEWPFNPQREEDDEEESKAFVLGRAAHHLFLGEDNFGLEFIQRPELLGGIKWHGNRLDCQAFLKQQASAGRTVLSPGDIKIIKGMAASLSQEQMAKDLLQGPVEQTLIAQDPETGLWLRGRPDVIPTADGMFADLKTTMSVVDIDLKSTLRSFGYHMQGALIWELCEMLDLPFDGFVLVFIEKKRPYCCRVVEITDDDLGRGRLQNRAMIRLAAKCIKERSWPGPGKADAELFSIPKSEQEYIDARLAALEAA
jgi:hypothetical protein